MPAIQQGIVDGLIGGTAEAYYMITRDAIGYYIPYNAFVETFTLTLSNPSGATIEKGVGTGTIFNTEDTEAALTAQFEEMPSEHDGANAFSFLVLFSQPIDTKFKPFRDHGFEVSAGTVTKAKRVDKRQDLWRITVEPDGDEDVTVTLRGDRQCSAAGAACAAEDARLSNTVTQTVPGPAETEPEAVALTASFTDMPSEHDGESAFSFRVAFSEAIDTKFKAFADGFPAFLLLGRIRSVVGGF